MKVSVVNSRDGWLEIQSKHGRPPRFIRRDVAARVGTDQPARIATPASIP